jgi:hypothetical protein
MTWAPSLATAVTFVWLGMVLAISFLEAPLKFRAAGVTLRIGLGIGRLVLRAQHRRSRPRAGAADVGHRRGYVGRDHHRRSGGGHPARTADRGGTSATDPPIRPDPLGGTCPALAKPLRLRHAGSVKVVVLIVTGSLLLAL